MTKTDTKTLAERIETDFLPFVRRPSRYIGGEINQVKKDLSRCDLKVALCFPDVYEVAMSHTGLAIIYDCLNRLTRVAAERAFAPWTDAEQIMRQKHIPLFSLESRLALKSFDIIGFSLTNELSYTNMLNMLDLAGLEIRSEKRKTDWPLVIAGAGMSNCCEPVADFVDVFVLGDGEQAVVELAKLLIDRKRKVLGKNDTLEEIAANFEWAYVPSFYHFEYENEKIKSFTPTLHGLPKKFNNAVVRDFDNAPVPTAPIVPFTQALHERVSVEVMRGCPGRCRFCQASYCKRPVRIRSVDRICELAGQIYHNTGLHTIGLLSLSTAEYPGLEQLVNRLHEYFNGKHVGISVPSLRVDRQLKLLPRIAKSIRKSGLTIAVEAADQHLRKILNKPIRDEDLFAAVKAAYENGWQKLKLYFMVGLPGETENNIKEIVTLSAKLADLRREITAGRADLNITVSWFVPKPHTPFGWLGQKPKSYFENAKQLILEEKRKLRAKTLHFKFHDINRTMLESAIGRGDRTLGPVLETAWRNGAKFDLWDEHFKFEIWQKAFQQTNLDIQKQAEKEFDEADILPWEHLGGPEKKYLLSHLQDAMNKLAGGEQ